MKAGDEIEGVVDSYVVDGILGEGGFGITHHATRQSDGAAVVLKQMRLERVESWKALELFEREAAVLANLDHPAIPRYIEFFAMTPDGPVQHVEGELKNPPESLVLVQDLVEGADLATRMAWSESFTEERVVSVVRSVLEVLSYLHGLSPPVIHRDVNPRNIIVDDDGSTYLVDFGAIQQQLQQQTVGGSTSVGTLGYIPIEQSLGKARPASDLYALAVTTVVLLTGMKPEELPLDDDTGKIDIDRLGLVDGSSSAARKNLVAFVEQALEPIVGKRIGSAKAGLEVLDGKSQLAVRQSDELAKPGIPTWKRTLFILCLGGSLGGAGIIYPLNFNNFSETEMVEMAPFWVLPAAFGFVGLLAQGTKRPITNAFLGTLFGAGCLVGFFATVWPML